MSGSRSRQRSPPCMGSTGNGADKNAKSNELGQNQFLTLMLAQLKNQDPMKPTDPTQFLSQLAQFSQVTSIAERGERRSASSPIRCAPRRC